jgi:hypothetical protein
MAKLSFLVLLASLCLIDGRTLAARGGARAAASKLSPNRAPSMSDAKVSTTTPAPQKVEKPKKERAPAPTMSAVPYQDAFTYELALQSKRRQATKRERAPAPTMAAVPYIDAEVYERALQAKLVQPAPKKERAPADMPKELVQYFFDRGLVNFFDPNGNSRKREAAYTHGRL